MYASFIRREKKAEKAIASHRANLAAIKESAIQQQIQEPSITRRIDAFLASAAADHAQNVSFSSDDEDGKKVTSSAMADNKKGASASGQLQSNSCPYPSAAEERVRLLTKFPADFSDELSKSEYSMAKQELGDFIAAWRGICLKNSISEVLMQMLFAHETESKKSLKKKRKLARLFKSYPAIGILNVAVLSMKAGHWNSLYDAFEEAVNNDVHDIKETNAVEAIDRIEVMASEPYLSTSRVLNSTDLNTDQVESSLEKVLEEVLGVLGEICKDVDNSLGALTAGGPDEEKFGLIVSRIIKCEKTLMERLLLKESFASKLGHYSEYAEQYLDKLSKIFTGICMSKVERSWKTNLPEARLQTFISQVVMAIGDADELSENHILQLLVRQFHVNNIGEWSLRLVEKHTKSSRIERISNFSSFYSCALLAAKAGRLPTSEAGGVWSVKNKEGSEAQTLSRVGLLGSVTSTDARNCLLKAPMLCDLLEWSQWDAIFSPTLGPLLDWLEREGSIGGLVCLVTCKGFILRIDGSATVDTFLAAAVKGLGKQAALQLVSLLAVYGGVDRVPQALLRSYSSQAIEILVGRPHMDDKNKRKIFLAHETGHLTKRAKHHVLEDAGSLSRLSYGPVGNWTVGKSFDKFSGAVQFVLDLLSCVPSEFVVFVASIVIPALSGIVPGASATMLDSCITAEHRIKLHEIGIALGITEWVRDFHSLFMEPHCPLAKRVLQVPSQNRNETDLAEASCLHYPVTVPLDVSGDQAGKDEAFAEGEGSLPSTLGIELGEQRDTSAFGINCGDVEPSNNSATSDGIVATQNQSRHEIEASEVIAMIRKEEFGMDLDLPSKELKLLTKQHARIGRALNCLSRELYSQDSHFVLELVQNADDNQYAPEVDAMLVFILQDKRVVVVNNELGFTPANMKALCDVGSSTKSGSAAGYIGHKGIGFKSVFRITDSPEIHSRGFHVKFDISGGNIGFVLPTVIPPVNDWHSIEEVLSTTEKLTKHEKQTWNTCMVLPLKSSIMNGPDIEMLSSKLGDIQSSLLLFLHRLSSITVKDYLTGSIRIMQRYDLDDGFIRVSDNGSSAHWLVVKQQLNAVVERPGVETTEIALAFPLREVSTGIFEACHEHQEVFSFLPLRSYGLRFIVQGDFVLPSSREDLDTDNAWNQWLLSEIPNVCLKAVQAIKKVSCFKQNPGKAATVLMSFIPLEGEVQGFFCSLPRMILASLRASQCLPVEGGEDKWALPCVLLGGWNESSRRLLPDKFLQELLGLYYLHRDVVITPVLASELGIHMYGSRVLIDFMECLCTRKEALEKLGPRWISSWLVALHKCFTSESQQVSCFSHTKAEVEDFKKLRSLPFIPLANGSYTSIEDGPVWLPCVDATTVTEITTLLEYFPLLYSELRTVHALLLESACKDSENPEGTDPSLTETTENKSLVCLMLDRLGVGQILGHEVVTSHILPSMISDNIYEKPKSLVMQCLAFVMVHLQSNCKQCKEDGLNIMGELQKNAILVTNNGYKRVSEGPLHFGVEFGCPFDVKKILKGLQIAWTEIDPAYLRSFQGWSEDVECSKWRSFLKELGATDFVKLDLVEKKLQCKAASIWKDISWEGYDDRDILNVRDWECPELVQILERLCDLSLDLPERLLQSSHLLAAFDLLWEECYSECKTTYWSESLVPKSKHSTIPSFILWLRSFAWVQSSFDEKLYRPTELFYRCSAIESILGNNAPYATPRIQSTKLAEALGLQTVLSAPVVLNVLRVWNQRPIQMSVGQMTRLYSFLWNEMTGYKEDILEFFHTQASIFVPETTNVKANVPVLGRFLFPKDVFWRDETGCLSSILQKFSADDVSGKRLDLRALSTFYPTLHAFFVDGCHVRDILNFKEYYNMLKILADTYSPHEVLDQVLAVFAMWSDNIKAGRVSSTDLSEWKELLQKIDSRVLPSVQDKWVSLHSGEGIVCWCDDEALGQQFIASKGIFYVCVSSSGFKTHHARDVNDIKIENLSSFLQSMDISPLSKVVEREPIVYGAQSSKQLLDLLNWTLPYVQRYLQKRHPNIYENLQQSRFDSRLNKLRCVVSEQLFFRYKLPGEFGTGTERVECSSLLEGDIFYATQLDNLNTLFLEFSKLFFSRMSDLQLANFLHLITLSVQSGSQETELEAILASQGIDPFPEHEKRWVFTSSHDEVPPESVSERDLLEPFLVVDSMPRMVVDSMPRKLGRGFAANTWPPRSSQQTAVSSVNYKLPHVDRLAACQRSLDTVMKEIEAKKKLKPRKRVGDGSLHSRDTESSIPSSMLNAETVHEIFQQVMDSNAGNGDGADNGTGTASKSGDEILALFSSRDVLPSNEVSFSDREQLSVGKPNEQQQVLTGRLGEAVVFNYLLEKHGPDHVRWINAETESGLPYDIVLEGIDGQQKLVEVKTTWSEDKDWFEITNHEWELACQAGERFIIIRVFLVGSSGTARFLWLPDPSKLCQERVIKLALILPQHHR